MSVHGEFERYLDATARALRETGRPEHVRCADDVDAVAKMRGEGLELRARRVLDGPLGQADSEWAESARLAEAVDRLLSISRIILGR